MPTRKRSALFAIVAICLFFAGCGDSKNPLSDPQKSKPDARLIGDWRLRWDERKDVLKGDVTYNHVEAAGDKLPKSVMRIHGVIYGKDGGMLDENGEFLAFPATLGANTYLNVTDASEKTTKLLEEKGWNPEAADGFLIMKYKVDGDALLLWRMDVAAQKKAIRSGKIKGDDIGFTDTTENVARFVENAGDSLFEKEAIRLERVNAKIPTKKEQPRVRTVLEMKPSPTIIITPRIILSGEDDDEPLGVTSTP